MKVVVLNIIFYLAIYNNIFYIIDFFSHYFIRFCSLALCFPDFICDLFFFFWLLFTSLPVA